MGILDQSISDTNALLVEYTSLDLPSELYGFSVDTYKQLSIKSLNKQSEVLSKLNEYVIKKEYSKTVQMDDPEGLEERLIVKGTAAKLQLLEMEFVQLLQVSEDYHVDALRALESSMEAEKT